MPSPESPAPGAFSSPASPRMTRLALVLGLAVGLGIATFAILEPADEKETAPLPPDVAAMVNGVVIGKSELDRAMEALVADSRNEPDAELRERMLERLIEQELLLQRAYDLGLDRSDRVVRNSLVSAMVQSVLASAPKPDTDPEEIRAFYEANRNFFALAGRVRVRALRFPVESPDGESDAKDRAEAAAARLRLDEPIETIRADLGGRLFTPVPDAPLPPSQLVTYLGPTPAREAMRLRVGEVSDPVRGGSAWFVLKVIERERGKVPPLEAVRQEVLNEMDRRAGEEALADYIEDLRRQADVRKAGP